MNQDKKPTGDKITDAPARRSDFLDSLWKGALIGALILVVAIPVIRYRQHRADAPPAAVAVAPVAAPAPTSPTAVLGAPPAQVEIRNAVFASHAPSPDARSMANWIVQSRDNADMSFVIIDKKDARVYVFDNTGKVKADTPALLGQAVGDDSAPGIGDKPLKLVKPEEKTTPAGRFIAELGENSTHEDVVWVDYDAAVSMHRVRPLVKSERRLERLASETPTDNRISFGCVNLPPAFYEGVLRPTVKAGKTVVYVLPETRPLQAQFANYKEPVMVAGAVAHP